MTRLLLWRHGQTEWNITGRFQGQQDPPLDREGREQAIRTAPQLVAAGLSAASTVVVSSDLSRAVDTATALTDLLGVPLLQDPRLREHGLGCWEGLTRDEVAARFPEDFARWRTTPERFARPGGEPLAAVAARVRRGLGELRATHRGETVAVVSHAIVTRLIVLGALGLGPERLWSVEASPAGITEIEYRDEDWATVHRVNTVAHLENGGPPRALHTPHTLGAPRDTRGAPRIQP